MEYDVSKEKGSNRYYVHAFGNPKAQIPGTYATKEKAMRLAAQMNGMTCKEFTRARRAILGTEQSR